MNGCHGPDTPSGSWQLATLGLIVFPRIDGHLLNNMEIVLL